MAQKSIGLCYKCSHGWYVKTKQRSKRCPKCKSTRIMFVKPKDLMNLFRVST